MKIDSILKIRNIFYYGTCCEKKQTISEQLLKFLNKLLENRNIFEILNKIYKYIFLKFLKLFEKEK